MWKQLTGEPVAGKLHTGFGGRGRRSPFPTPIPSDKLDRSLCRFAQAYADQTEADHQTLVKAVARGVLPVEYGEQGAGKTGFRP
jgi:hypothetical protein